MAEAVFGSTRFGDIETYQGFLRSTTEDEKSEDRCRDLGLRVEKTFDPERKSATRFPGGW